MFRSVAPGRIPEIHRQRRRVPRSSFQFGRSNDRIPCGEIGDKEGHTGIGKKPPASAVVYEDRAELLILARWRNHVASEVDKRTRAAFGGELATRSGPPGLGLVLAGIKAAGVPPCRPGTVAVAGQARQSRPRERAPASGTAGVPHVCEPDGGKGDAGGTAICPGDRAMTGQRPPSTREQTMRSEEHPGKGEELFRSVSHPLLPGIGNRRPAAVRARS